MKIWKPLYDADFLPIKAIISCLIPAWGILPLLISVEGKIEEGKCDVDWVMDQSGCGNS